MIDREKMMETRRRVRWFARLLQLGAIDRDGFEHLLKNLNDNPLPGLKIEEVASMVDRERERLGKMTDRELEDEVESHRSIVEVKPGQWAQFEMSLRGSESEAGEVVFCEGGIVVIRIDKFTCEAGRVDQIVQNWPDRASCLEDLPTE